MVTIKWAVVLEKEDGTDVRHIIIETSGSTKMRCCERLAEALMSETGWVAVYMVVISATFYGSP